MFKTGDVVIYGAQGICKICGTEVKKIGKTSAEYYVLKPIFNDSTALFVPVANEVLTAKMQNIMTKAQADEFIQKISQIDVFEIKDEIKKQEEYKKVLSYTDREKLVSLIKTIRTERDLRRQSGKKLNISDEQTLRKAEYLLYNEFAFVLGVTPDEVQNIINF